jgi:hypothetical protein
MRSRAVRGAEGATSSAGNSFNSPHGLGDIDSGSVASDYSGDTLDELLSRIQCSYSPILKAKLSGRYVSRSCHRHQYNKIVHT